MEQHSYDANQSNFTAYIGDGFNKAALTLSTMTLLLGGLLVSVFYH